MEEAIWQTEGAQKRSAVQHMFAEIAPTYDLLNSLICMRLHFRWRAFSVQTLRLRAGDKALDVCCGTGDFMVPLKKAVGEKGFVTGIDFCNEMLAVAHKKMPKASLALGDACCLPIRSESFEGVSVGWGIRNVPDIDAAHRELVRVLKPGGRFVSLDMARPKNRAMAGFSTWAFRSIVPRIGALFGKTKAYTYLPKSTEQFWTREQLGASMESAGLVDVGHKDLMFGNICVHWGRKP